MSSARSRARRLALQALYEWQMSGTAVGEINSRFLASPESNKADRVYFSELLLGVVNHLTDLDAQITPVLSRPLDEVDMVEKAVLRLSAYELQHRLDIPYKVVINEGVELAKTFGADKGHRFVNGILDKLAVKLRKVETGSA
ncbi:MAG: transcription antitermination factor NusB [Gammaproteobacteria bacterium]|nr:transcription antitermination factor NusB [Gammaproteobacteria bacterium]MDH5650877.1 transcription antitermination factor NusB [Gammaproteobacteria bacterium]